jgi:hypothetical protein
MNKQACETMIALMDLRPCLGSFRAIILVLRELRNEVMRKKKDKEEGKGKIERKEW